MNNTNERPHLTPGGVALSHTGWIDYLRRCARMWEAEGDTERARKLNARADAAEERCEICAPRDPA